MLHGAPITNFADTKEGGGRTCRKVVRKLSESLYYYQRIIQSDTIVCSLSKQTCFYNSSLHVSTYRADSHTKQTKMQMEVYFLKEILQSFLHLWLVKLHKNSVILPEIMNTITSSYSGNSFITKSFPLQRIYSFILFYFTNVKL